MMPLLQPDPEPSPGKESTANPLFEQQPGHGLRSNSADESQSACARSGDKPAPVDGSSRCGCSEGCAVRSRQCGALQRALFLSHTRRPRKLCCLLAGLPLLVVAVVIGAEALSQRVAAMGAGDAEPTPRSLGPLQRCATPGCANVLFAPPAVEWVERVMGLLGCLAACLGSGWVAASAGRAACDSCSRPPLWGLPLQPLSD